VAALGAVLTAVLVVAAAASLLAAGYFNRAAQRERDARQEADRQGAAERWERYRSNIAAASAACKCRTATPRARLFERCGRPSTVTGMARLHNQLDGAILVMHVPGGKYRSHVLSPSGRQTAVAASTKTRFILYDVPTVRSKLSARPFGPATSVAYRPDGKQVATASTIRRSASGIQRGPRTRVLKSGSAPGNLDHDPLIAYSADGSRIVAMRRNGCHDPIVGTSTGKLVALGEWQELGHLVAFSPDGRRGPRVLGICLSVRRRHGARRLAVMPHVNLVRRRDFLARQQAVAPKTKEDDNGILSGTARWRRNRRLARPYFPSWSGAFSPDGSWLLSGALPG